MDVSGFNASDPRNRNGASILGLKPQDRVLMRLGNTIDFPITFLAAISVGLIPVPSPAQWTQKEVDHAVSLILPGRHFA